MLNIKITVPTDPQYWGEVNEKQAKACALIHMGRLHEWAHEQWPDATIHSTLTPEGKEALAYDGFGDVFVVINAIAQRAKDTWCDDADAALRGVTE